MILRLNVSKRAICKIYVFQEKQANIQSVKKMEKLKRDFDKLQTDGAALVKERNEAVGQVRFTQSCLTLEVILVRMRSPGT